MRAEPNYPTLGKKAGSKLLIERFYFIIKRKLFFLDKVKSITEKVRGMSDKDIEQLLSKGENESPLTVIDDVPIESEDVHIVYRVAKQTQYEATAEKGVCLHLSILHFI